MVSQVSTALCVWAAFAVICVVLFRAPLIRLIDRIKRFEIKWPGGNIKLTAAETSEAAQTLLNETIEMIGQLGPAERKILGQIVRDLELGKMVTPDTLFSPEGFSRHKANGEDTSELVSLRKLRDAQLIRPKGRGRFENNKEIELKTFGQILLRTNRDKLIAAGP